jgi:hypothetical protein
MERRGILPSLMVLLLLTVKESAFVVVACVCLWYEIFTGPWMLHSSVIGKNNYLL